MVRRCCSPRVSRLAPRRISKSRHQDASRRWPALRPQVFRSPMALRLDRLRRQPLAAFNRREHLCGDRGFSLAEVLVATLIFVGGIVAVAHLMVVAVQLHLLGKHTAEAAILAS